MRAYTRHGAVQLLATGWRCGHYLYSSITITFVHVVIISCTAAVMAMGTGVLIGIGNSRYLALLDTWHCDLWVAELPLHVDTVKAAAT